MQSNQNTHDLRSSSSAKSLPFESLAAGDGRAEVSKGTTTPYTFEAHAKWISESTMRSHEAAKVCQRLVQVQKSKVVYCARIADAFTIPNGPDCWKVESLYPEKAIFSVPVSKVRLCGDSQCTCLDEKAGADRASFSSHEAAPAFFGPKGEEC